MSASSAVAYPGDLLTYEVSINNLGSVTQPVQYTTTLPVYVTLVSGSTTFSDTVPPGAEMAEDIVVAVASSAPAGAELSATTVFYDGTDVWERSAVVEVASYGVTLEPSTDAMVGDLGTWVSYTLRVINAGNITDTFDLTYAGNTWDVHLPVTSTTLAAGEGADVIVQVDILADAADGDSDSVTVTATSQGDGAASDSSVLTTTAVWRKIYLPLVMRLYVTP